MREPLRWCLRLGERGPVEQVGAAIRWASRGPAEDSWDPPTWLLPHQVDAARRIAGSLTVFGGALLGDAVGLGKTYVALAVATRYRRAAVLAPASLLTQWRQAASQLAISLDILSDQRLSRGQRPPSADLLVVDEAHRFRNPDTRRFDQLARGRHGAHLLLLTATPVVNRASDLASLLQLFLPDNALALFGLPSLRAAIAARQFDLVAQASAAVIVARSPVVLGNDERIPQVSDASVVALPPVSAENLPQLLGLLDGLRFPSFADRTAANLLALHLRYRLASSTAALAETVERHLSYLHRAIGAAERGERLSRPDARALFGPEDDAQLSLEFGRPTGAVTLDPGELTAERRRLELVREWVHQHRGSSPKADRLVQLLSTRERRKTIVFISAVATARDLAQRLGWRRVAVVSGRGAWIASGSIPTEAALRLFAPKARAAPDPEASAVVQTLLATDLVSEGLNLQDADAIVHYDLPWTPLRLQQRLGRIARLGSAHSHVDVWWFAPPPGLESALDLTRRIADKVAQQLRLGVPVSSHVGRGSVIGQAFESRERLASEARGRTSGGPFYARVDGPLAAAFVLEWRSGKRRIPEVVVMEAGQQVKSIERWSELIQALLDAPISCAPPPLEYIRVLRQVVRQRLQAAERGSTDPQLLNLARRVSRQAALAARSRDWATLSLLDAMLGRLLQGVTEGERREWDDTLGDRSRLTRSVRLLAPANPGPFSVTLEAALFGAAPAPLSSPSGQ